MPRVPWQDLNFYPYKLSDLKFTALPYLHVDFYSPHVVNSVSFFLHNCPLLIPLHVMESTVDNYEERMKHYIYIYMYIYIYIYITYYSFSLLHVLCIADFRFYSGET